MFRLYPLLLSGQRSLSNLPIAESVKRQSRTVGVVFVRYHWGGAVGFFCANFR